MHERKLTAMCLPYPSLALGATLAIGSPTVLMICAHHKAMEMGYFQGSIGTFFFTRVEEH
jgi:hypothetical protein